MLKEHADDIKEMNGKWQHLVDYCIDTFTDIDKSDYRKKKIEEIKESHEAYNQVDKKTSDPWEGASSMVLPLTTISVDNHEPRLVASMTGKRPYLQFEMESEQPKDEQTELLEEWFNNELEETLKIERIASSIAHYLELEGTVFALAEYDIDEVTRRDFLVEGAEAENPQEQEQIVRAAMEAGGKPMNGVWIGKDGEPLTIEKTDSVFEGAKVSLLPFSDVYIPDDTEDWEKTPVVRRVNKTYAELMRKKDETGYLNIGPWLVKEEGDRELSGEQQSTDQKLDDVRATAKKQIECIECAVSYIYQDEDQDDEDLSDFTEERLVVLIALEKKVILRMMLLRDLNFKNEHVVKRIRIYPERGKAYGTSSYGKIRSVQKGASKTFNMAINIAEVVLIPWFLFTEKVGLKGKEFKLKPGMGVPVDSVDGLYFPTFNINPTHMLAFMDPWINFWEKLLSIGDLQVGRPAQKHTTATETMAVIQEGNVKHNYQALTYRDEYLSLLRTIYDLYYQNMPFDKTFLYNGQQVPIPRHMMARPKKFKLTGSTEVSNKLIERKEAEDFYGFTINDPNGVFDPLEPAKDLLRHYNRTDIEKYINPQLNQIAKQLREFPQAAELFNQAMQETMQIAQNIEQQAKGGGG